jgi:hypothetical protein
MPLESCHQPEVFSEAFSSTVGKLKKSIHISRSIVFLLLGKTWDILHDNGTELFKTNKSVTVVRKPEQMRYLHICRAYS